jgi:hypothetical protein
MHVDSSVVVVGGASIMLSSVFDSLFGCSHQRTTFPMTPKRPTARLGAYVSCLDCGKEFAYNWNEMRMEQKPFTVAPDLPPSTRMAGQAQGLSRLLRLGS